LYSAVFLLATASLALAQTSGPASQPNAASNSQPSGSGRVTRNDEPNKIDSPKLAADSADLVVSDPLVRMLVAKGVLTAPEGRSISTSGTPVEQRDRLAALLREKGLISNAEFEAVRTVAASSEATATGSLPAGVSGQKPEQVAAPKPATVPAVIAAVAPIRVLQVDPPKREGLIPDVKLGSGARMKFYGFFKASMVHDSSSPQGNDFPLPGFLGDTGPDNSPEFHIKARAFRFGANFEWLDMAPKTTLTGRIELDFEGNFTRVNNRNISSIRSSQPSIRLAWVRIDRRLGEKSTAFALFGQDWTPFGSSTLPNLIETTGLGLGFGTLYERAPQSRFGLNYKVGGKRGLTFQPEFALVLPAFGDVPANVFDQLGFGERQGVDSNRPEVQGRFVTQFQLDKAPGVVPAQLIVSFEQGRRTAIVTAAAVPTGFKTAFPTGAQVSSSTNGYTLEAQLPTRFVTVLAKYYYGSDLRFYFAGQLLSNFNDTFGLTSQATATSIDGASTVVFGLLNGVPTVAPQRPVRAEGGFINLGFPLSRIFNADPKGRNAGWSAYLHYGLDEALPRDARRFAGGANRSRSDVFLGNIQYKLNSFVTFAWEESLYRTHAANRVGILPLFRGIPSFETHDLRSEFATIFTF
jgi:hypothetical protein